MNRIRDLRVAAGWTQTQLGKRIDAAKTTVSGYENEERQLTPALICALCDIFGCTSDYLLCRSDTPLPALSDADARLVAAYHDADQRDRDYIDHLLHLDEPDVKKTAV